MTKLRSLIVGASLFLLSGCATTMTPISPSVQRINIPELNQIRTAELGDTILSKGDIYTYEGMDLENQVTAGDGFLLKKMILNPSTLIAKQEDPGWKYFFSDQLSIYDAILGTTAASGGLKMNKTKPDKIDLFTNSPTSFGMAPSKKPIFKLRKIKALDRPSFQQELIYNGKTGENVKFLYREFSNDSLRAPFSQEIQYDLAESHEIGFKGARIELIEATNTHLKYKAIRNFPDIIGLENIEQPPSTTPKVDPSAINPPISAQNVTVTK